MTNDQMSIDKFCTRARDKFELRPPGQDYIEVLVDPQRDCLETDEPAHKARPINPLIFVTGVRGPQHGSHAMTRFAEVSSVNVVVGTYGLGKTELMHQLCNHILKNRAHVSSPQPLPVNLALCNHKRGLLNEATVPSGEVFSQLLFSHLIEDEDDCAFTAGPLLSAIAGGEVFLLLDGLDELVISGKEYQGFLGGLANLLALGAQIRGSAAPLFRIVISMRYELLTATDSDGGADLVRTLRSTPPGGEPLPVYFLRLDLFDDSRVQLYMKRRGLEPHWFPEVSRHHALLEVLYRPLLLRIFCDMALGPEREKVFQKLASYKHAAQLIDDYVTLAEKDYELRRAQEAIESLYQWDSNELARECLDLYLRGIDFMRVENLRNILRPDARQISKDDVWRGIHKCPFLRRSGNKAFFTHRSFLEFFVAKGVSLDMERSENEERRFSAFDTLVLNVDTRKFLKSIVVEKADEEVWFQRTFRAYGLANPEEWEPPYPPDLKELDEQRRALLDAMTEPEDKKVNETARVYIRKFVERADDHDRLHPRYLTYNYEAVAVFLKNNRGEDLLIVREQFRNLLRDRLEKTMNELGSLPGIKSYLREPLELLVERILNIAQRLRYPWAPVYTEDLQKERLKTLISAGATQDRIFTILDDIERTVFPMA
ncbi:MAG TPA: hypothetical protein VH988_19480 [Thermoanaerobaculia bacterium]|jgi:hypothetical protein|nr:hypothetical protein [Thermoanaerobaculia bacterium]